MVEIIVDENIAGQRIDRFARKFLDKGSLSFIYKMIRKKNILVNDKKVKEDEILNKGDRVTFYLSDQTIEKFQSSTNEYYNKVNLDIVYEDQNIIIVNKAKGILSHSDGKDEKNLVDGIVRYLIDSGQFDPKANPTFTPALANRLDKNTSGLVIGGKNLQALRQLNRAFKNSTIRRLYLALVKGSLQGQETLTDTIEIGKDNISLVGQGGKEISTSYRSIASNEELSLIELELHTGRTHQIRAHMDHLGHPILGDPKYGDSEINKAIKKRYNNNNQLLHCYKICFNGCESPLEYLNGREFQVDYPKDFKKILKGEKLWENI